MSLHFGPTTNLAVQDTAQIGHGAATETGVQTSTGPVTVTQSGAGSKSQQITYVAFTAPNDDSMFYEVSVSFRYAVTVTGPDLDWSIDLCAMDGPSSDLTTFATLGKATVDFASVTADGKYHLVSVVGLRANSTLTVGDVRNFGIGVRLAYTGSNSVSVILRDMTARLAVIKR